MAIVDRTAAAAAPAPRPPDKRAFKSYGIEAARSFLKTAVIIDDEIIADGIQGLEISEVTPPPFAALGGEVASIEASAPPFAQDPPLMDAGEVSRQDAEVPIKPLADAFLDKQIVCGVLKPEAADTNSVVVERAVRAAAVADVIIIDWYLRRNSDKLALSILTDVLRSDHEQNGRLRTVLVYTSATPLVDRRDKLAAHLTKSGFEVNTQADDDTLLSVDACRVKFIQKRSMNAGVSVQDLPELAIAEFAKHSSGLLANFALLGVAALRNSTYHVLANLSSKMDSAFVGHRMLLKDVTGAQSFAMSLFMLQMKSVLSLPDGLRNALNDEEVSAWFEDRFNYPEADSHLANLGTDKKKLLTSVLSGEGRLDVAHKALFLPETRKSPEDVANEEQAVGRQFSRFATFVREHEGFNPLPKGWLPTLTLGTVVKLTGKEARYFMCVQPACDTVRIDDERYFPFIELTAKTTSSSDNLSLVDDGEAIVVAVSNKAGSRHYAKFKPKEQGGSIIAEPVRGKFVFPSTQEHYYWWLGDIDPMKAQRIAVDLSGTLARVGIDEYEWLRRGGSAK